MFTPLRVAVIVAIVLLATDAVAAVNVAFDVPSATFTDAGTVAVELLEDNVTDVPPVGAGPLKVTVPVDGLPPTTDIGFRLSTVNAGGVIVS